MTGSGEARAGAAYHWPSPMRAGCSGRASRSTADTQERTVEVPADFAAALRESGLTKAFDALSYTHRKEHVRAIEEAKKPETRARRIEAAIAKLR